MAERRFPIQRPYDKRDAYQVHGIPASVPWSFVEPHRKQIEDNHGGQTLEHLVERNGLSPYELWCGVTGRGLFWEGYGLTETQFGAARDRLAKLIEDSDARTRTKGDGGGT